MTAHLQARSAGEAVRLGTALLRGRFADGSPEWHEARASVIGGSEVGSIMGVNSFESRYVLWYRKAGYLGKTEEVANPLFEWGHRLEPVVAEKFADMHPEYDVQVSGSWVHQDRPWHGANPDRLLAYKLNYIDEAGNELADVMDVEAVLEIKTSMSGYGWENDMCPVKYVLQLRWYMECFGLDYGLPGGPGVPGGLPGVPGPAGPVQAGGLHADRQPGMVLRRRPGNARRRGGVLPVPARPAHPGGHPAAHRRRAPTPTS